MAVSSPSFLFFLFFFFFFSLIRGGDAPDTAILLDFESAKRRRCNADREVARSEVGGSKGEFILALAREP